MITGVGLSQEEFKVEVEKANQKQCELRKEQLIKSSKDARPIVATYPSHPNKRAISEAWAFKSLTPCRYFRHIL